MSYQKYIGDYIHLQINIPWYYEIYHGKVLRTTNDQRWYVFDINEYN